MATFRHRGESWEVQLCVNRQRKTATFPTKRECKEWAARTEIELRSVASGAVPDKPFSALLEKYRDEVSVTKRGERWERLRLNLIMRDELAGVRLPALNASHFASWRDRRLAQVSAASVRREWTLLSHALGVAVREWKWLKENPIKEVRRPPPPRSRDRRIGASELAALRHTFGWDGESKPANITQRVAVAVDFAIETAMRCGEICSMQWGEVLESVVHLPLTKNGTRRDVPLSTRAKALLELLRGVHAERVFDLATSQIDAIFRKARDKALIVDLHFHDTRHEAITRLASRLDVLDLARMVGVRDLRILMVYYNARAEEIAARLG